jgi:hypothetical protein
MKSPGVGTRNGSGSYEECDYHWRNTIMKSFILSSALAVFAITASAQTSFADYYVVRDASTKKCTVVDTKPTTTTTTVVDNGTYKTKTEAESGMKTTKVCTEN